MRRSASSDSRFGHIGMKCAVFCALAGFDYGLLLLNRFPNGAFLNVLAPVLAMSQICILYFCHCCIRRENVVSALLLNVFVFMLFVGVYSLCTEPWQRSEQLLRSKPTGVWCGDFDLYVR